MKVLALPIEMVSYTDNKGYINPIRFRMQIANTPVQVIKGKINTKIIKENYDDILKLVYSIKEGFIFLNSIIFNFHIKRNKAIWSQTAFNII